jgi:hypothetical protein
VKALGGYQSGWRSHKGTIIGAKPSSARGARRRSKRHSQNDEWKARHGLTTIRVQKSMPGYDYCVACAKLALLGGDGSTGTKPSRR